MRQRGGGMQEYRRSKAEGKDRRRGRQSRSGTREPINTSASKERVTGYVNCRLPVIDLAFGSMLGG